MIDVDNLSEDIQELERIIKTQEGLLRELQQQLEFKQELLRELRHRGAESVKQAADSSSVQQCLEALKE
jgi:hypothetical protein